MSLEKNAAQDLIARRIAQELEDGDIVNLGIGIPTQVPSFLPEGVNILLQSENGVIGFGDTPEKGKEDKDLINAGGQPITEIPGTCFVDSVESFAMIRGGHISMTVLGALQVDSEGSIANWMIPGKFVPGIGGAMDLCSGAKRVVAAMFHLDKNGNSKVLKKCSLPLTAYKRLSFIVTDMAFLEVSDKGLILKEVASWTTVEDVIKNTDATLIIPDQVGTFN